ncbi:MAG: YccF domain-containing protein [Muribaculaceae bacterium]|nr:YccF domain-containing protein [Muribaculaceae bacterium]
MNIFLNIIWLVFGGVMIAIEYAVSSLLLMITIIGIPFGLQTFKLAVLALWPFGAGIESGSWPSGCLAGIMNVIWWFVGGFPIALTHLFWGLIFCITIIGIPFGKQHFKLMRLALFPFGNKINTPLQ